MILFVFHSSSHNFQNLTVNPRFVRVPTLFFYDKIDLRLNGFLTLNSH
ncbi:hypothetical protein LEP1GSC037_1456 [Leptospira interrogans str. 2006001854]|uniref:Uncharacterized protein n=1 Tax=Leptospira interrogans str. 2006001854 TaxID=1001590 RepID=M6GQ52_LEPIR|nr:hypothetical protein LEP1GSC037_1456 [Leptospira interrogans str. 2006001854]